MKDKELDPKVIEYASAIVNAIGEMLDDGTNMPIDRAELNEGDNLTHFIHAIANMAPTMIYNSLTGDNKNQVEFNHLANSLCIQYITGVE